MHQDQLDPAYQPLKWNLPSFLCGFLALVMVGCAIISLLAKSTGIFLLDMAAVGGSLGAMFELLERSRRKSASDSPEPP